MADVTAEELLFLYQNWINPVVFYPIIIFLTGCVSQRLGFGIGRKSIGLDRYLSALGVGFAIQLPSLAISFAIAQLLSLENISFQALFSVSLLLSSLFILLGIAFRKAEHGKDIAGSYRAIATVFWIVLSVCIAI